MDRKDFERERARIEKFRATEEQIQKLNQLDTDRKRAIAGNLNEGDTVKEFTYLNGDVFIGKFDEEGQRTGFGKYISAEDFSSMKVIFLTTLRMERV